MTTNWEGEKRGAARGGDNLPQRRDDNADADYASAQERWRKKKLRKKNDPSRFGMGIREKTAASWENTQTRAFY